MDYLIYLISLSLQSCPNALQLTKAKTSTIPPFRNQHLLTPFDVPHIFEQILSYLDKPTVRSCQIVNKHWYTFAAPVSWHDTIQNDSAEGHSPEHWNLLQRNLQHIHTLTWTLSSDNKLRVERLLQLADALSRRRTRIQNLTLQGSYALDDDLRAILPSLPNLRQLSLQAHWAQFLEDSTPIRLESIFEHAKNLKALRLRDNITLSFNGIKPCFASDHVVPYSPVSNAYLNARGLVSLDVLDVSLSAQQIMELTDYFPNLQTLKVDVTSLSSTMEQYQSPTMANAMRSSSHLSNSQVFARDIATGWPKLFDVTIRHHLDHCKSNLMETTLSHTRDFVAELAPSLKSLDISAALLHDELLDILTDNACILQSFLSVPRSRDSRTDFPSSSALRLLKNCKTLKVVDIGFLMDLTLFDTSLSVQELTPPPSPVLRGWRASSPPPTPRLSTTQILQQPWACSNLKYLDIPLKYHGETRVGYSKQELQLCSDLYKQVSRLTQLRVLSMKGTYYIPNDLKGSGFYQLASLKELRAISICLFQEKTVASGQGSGKTKSKEETAGCLYRKDLEWMVKQWPSINLLEFRGSFNEAELKTAQSWVDEITGRSGRITVSDGRNSYISSVRGTMGME
ncbi:hypothetical protein BGX27_011191 [Mortierella sp. AM989]|nr:hypothetical protein BGX27_011191 [Mortierella sp. AM989]